jgi:hypothetical protein
LEHHFDTPIFFRIFAKKNEIMDTFETIKQDNRLLYQYIRGSWAHGVAIEGKSDIDRGGIFLAKKKDLIDLGFNYQPQVSDEKNDNVWYELKRFMTLLIKSNPTVLESLFVADKFVEFEHPIIKTFKENRNEFLTKQCFPSFFAYAKSQIEKAKGLNKMINWDKEQMKRKTPFDFAYTFYVQGSTKIGNWLDNRGLNKDFCGLVHIPNMHDTYGVYYDWGAHFKANGIKNVEDLMRNGGKTFDFIVDFYNLLAGQIADWFERNKEVKHYRGMCLENATDMRGSSVSKGEKPIVHMVYNESGFQAHCVKYKQYQDWIKHRNPIRYESNLNKSYDAKNMSECFRLMRCGIEIANGDGYLVDRSGIDADFLLDIKSHKFEYDELMEKLKEENARMNEAMKRSTIKEEIDPNFVNDLYLDMVKKVYF